MKLGIDLDGVIYPFNKQWENYVRGWYTTCQRDYGIPDIPQWARDLMIRFPKELPRIGHNWKFYEALGLSDEDFGTICHQGVDEGYIFWVGEPYPGARPILERLRKEGHTIHIITHRFFGRKSVVATEEWLTDNEIPFDTLTFAKDKSIVGVDLLVDDLWTNLDAMSYNCFRVLMNQTWNRVSHIPNYRTGLYDHRLYHLSKLPELVREVEAHRG